MALVTTKDMFEKALKNDYAIGAFNVNNMEIQMDNVSKKIETLSKNKKEMKETKNAFDAFISRLDMQEQRISKPEENRSIETSQTEMQRENRKE